MLVSIMIISTVQNSALDEKSSYCQIRIVGKRVNRGGCRFVARSYRKGSARLSGVRRAAARLCIDRGTCCRAPSACARRRNTIHGFYALLSRLQSAQGYYHHALLSMFNLKKYCC